MKVYSATKEDVKDLATSIETLAHQVKESIDSNSNYFNLANELVRSTQTFVFALGEVYAVDRLKESNAVKTSYTRSLSSLNAKVVKEAKVKTPRAPAPPRSYVRDNKGRFANV